MVQPDFNVIISSFQVVVKYLQGLYHGKEFFVMVFLVAFCWLQRLGVIGNWMPTIQGIWLFQNSACSKIAGICDEAKWFAVVWQSKDWGCGK
jgi:hypothetical protein